MKRSLLVLFLFFSLISEALGQNVPGLTRGGTGMSAKPTGGGQFVYVDTVTRNKLIALTCASSTFPLNNGSGNTPSCFNLFGTANTWTAAQTFNAGVGSVVLKDNGSNITSMQFKTGSTTNSEITSNSGTQALTLEGKSSGMGIVLKPASGANVAINNGGLIFPGGALQTGAGPTVVTTATLTYDVPSITAGNGAAISFAGVGGALLGDFCLASFATAGVSGISVTCNVISTDTVLVALNAQANAGTVDLPNGVWKIMVLRY